MSASVARAAHACFVLASCWGIVLGHRVLGHRAGASCRDIVLRMLDMLHMLPMLRKLHLLRAQYMLCTMSAACAAHAACSRCCVCQPADLDPSANH